MLNASATGSWWLHLRRCAECGHSGCCEFAKPHVSSAYQNRHAADPDFGAASGESGRSLWPGRVRHSTGEFRRALRPSRVRYSTGDSGAIAPLTQQTLANTDEENPGSARAFLCLLSAVIPANRQQRRPWLSGGHQPGVSGTSTQCHGSPALSQSRAGLLCF